METIKLPFYVKASLTFIGLLSFVATLYFAQRINFPLIYAMILATVLSPIVLFFWTQKDKPSLGYFYLIAYCIFGNVIAGNIAFVANEYVYRNISEAIG